MIRVSRKNAALYVAGRIGAVCLLTGAWWFACALSRIGRHGTVVIFTRLLLLHTPMVHQNKCLSSINQRQRCMLPNAFRNGSGKRADMSYAVSPVC